MKNELDLQQLAETVAAHGVAAVEPTTIDALATYAGRVGANPVLIGIVADGDAPAPARVRAFGRVLTQVSRHEPSQFIVAA
jgi:hypothetical protein